MAGNQPARIPPVRNSWALVTTAGGDGAVPAPAPGAAAEEKEAEGPAEAPAGTAGPATTGTFVARVAASPGVNVDVEPEVRIKMEDGKFVEGVITGRRSVDSSYPVAPLGLSGERGPVLNLMHGRHFFTVAEYERDYASQHDGRRRTAARLETPFPGLNLKSIRSKPETIGIRWINVRESGGCKPPKARIRLLVVDWIGRPPGPGGPGGTRSAPPTPGLKT